MKQSRPRDCGPPRRPSPSPSPWKSMRGVGHGCATNHGSHDAIGDRVNVTRVFCNSALALCNMKEAQEDILAAVGSGRATLFLFPVALRLSDVVLAAAGQWPPSISYSASCVVRDALCPARRSCWTLRAGALDDPGSCQGGDSAPCRQFPLAQPATHRAATGNLWPNGPWGLAH